MQIPLPHVFFNVFLKMFSQMTLLAMHNTQRNNERKCNTAYDIRTTPTVKAINIRRQYIEQNAAKLLITECVHLIHSSVTPITVVALYFLHIVINDYKRQCSSHRITTMSLHDMVTENKRRKTNNHRYRLHREMIFNQSTSLTKSY